MAELLRETKSRIRVRGEMGRVLDSEGGEARMPTEPITIQYAVGRPGRGDGQN